MTLPYDVKRSAGRPPQLSVAIWRLLLAEYTIGVSVNELSQKYRSSPTAIRVRLKKEKIKKPSPAVRRRYKRLRATDDDSAATTLGRDTAVSVVETDAIVGDEMLWDIINPRHVSPVEKVTEIQQPPTVEKVTEIQQTPTAEKVTEIQQTPTVEKVTEPQQTPTVEKVTELRDTIRGLPKHAHLADCRDQIITSLLETFVISSKTAKIIAKIMGHQSRLINFRRPQEYHESMMIIAACGRLINELTRRPAEFLAGAIETAQVARGMDSKPVIVFTNNQPPHGRAK